MPKKIKEVTKLDKELKSVLIGESMKNQKIIKQNWNRLSSPWFKDYIKSRRLERKYWDFIYEEFPGKIQKRIRILKEKKNNIGRNISAQEIGNNRKPYKEKRRKMEEYEIQIRECQKILDALRQGISEMVGCGSDSPYPPIDEILEEE